MESENVNITVSHRGQTYSLSLLPDTTLNLLLERLEELTSIPPPLQKLLYKGNKNGKGQPKTDGKAATGTGGWIGRVQGLA